MQRLNALDTAFLHLETDEASLHIASVAIFEGPAPDFEEVRSSIRRRLHRVPKWRQRLQRVPFELGRPVWVDDEDFDLSEHVRHAEVPAPGGAAELHEVVDQIMSRHLDLARPPWEDWVLTGLADGRWGLVTKIHHSMVDGIAGTDLLSTLLDHAPDTPEDEPEPWQPERTPGPARLLGRGLRDSAALRVREARAAARAVRATTQPRGFARRSLALASGFVRWGLAAVPTAPTPLIGPIGAERTYRWTSLPLTDLLAVKQHFGVKVNDVVLAAMTRGYQDLLVARETPFTEHAVRTLIPVSVRHGESYDNQVSALLLDLPVGVRDPRERLLETAVRMRRLKASHESEAGELITDVGDALPAPLLAGFLHLFFRIPQRHLTTVVTNVPGPADRLYLLGRRMLHTYPYVCIADRVRVGIAVTSYDGQLLVGITADRGTVPDLSVLVAGVEQGFAELVAAAASPHEEVASWAGIG